MEDIELWREHEELDFVNGQGGGVSISSTDLEDIELWREHEELDFVNGQGGDVSVSSTDSEVHANNTVTLLVHDNVGEVAIVDFLGFGLGVDTCNETLLSLFPIEETGVK